jgi:PAS domain S-box-containing protein
VTGPEKDPCVREVAALRERVRYLEEVEKEFAALARALKESEERYRLLVEKIRDGIFIAQDERVKFFNPSMLEIMGCTAKELDAVPIADLIGPEDRERVLGRYRRILAGADIKGALAFRALRKGGQEF